jgi:hypothetical protein
MTDPLLDQVLRALDQAAPLYERLVLVVAPSGAGKTKALQAVASRTGAPCLNVNLAVSRALLDVPPHQRPLRVQRVLDELVDPGEQLTILDNLELLFDPALEVQPLGWLRRLARGRAVVAAWNGVLDQGYVTYADEGDREYRREPAADVIVVPSEKDA